LPRDAVLEKKTPRDLPKRGREEYSPLKKRSRGRRVGDKKRGPPSRIEVHFGVRGGSITQPKENYSASGKRAGSKRGDLHENSGREKSPLLGVLAGGEQHEENERGRGASSCRNPYALLGRRRPLGNDLIGEGKGKISAGKVHSLRELTNFHVEEFSKYGAVR